MLSWTKASGPALFPPASLSPLTHGIFSFPSATCTISLLQFLIESSGLNYSYYYLKSMLQMMLVIVHL